MELTKGKRYIGTTTACVDWRRVYNDVAFTAALDQTVDDGDDSSIEMVRISVLKHPRHPEVSTRLYLAGSIREVEGDR